MTSEKLSRHEHYSYIHSDFFKNSLDLIHAFIMEDYSIGMHEQEFYEINVITKGRGVHYINENRVVADVGDVFIIPPKIGHGYIGGRGFDVFHVILSDGFMNKYIADLQQLPSFYTLFGAEPLMRGRTSVPLHLTLSAEKLKKITNILSEIVSSSNYEDPVDCLTRSSLAMVAIGLLCSEYSGSASKSEHLLSDDRALMESISYIHERYFEKITIDDLIRIAHISRSSYIRRFKEICGMAPSAYITKVRLDSASAMLINTTISVSEIAGRTGFYDASHFTKSFENFYGIYPLEYRNKKRGIVHADSN